MKVHSAVAGGGGGVVREGDVPFPVQSAEALTNLNSYLKKMAVVSFPVFNYTCA